MATQKAKRKRDIRKPPRGGGAATRLPGVRRQRARRCQNGTRRSGSDQEPP
ncbi:hypothetical protein PSMK_12870 [Phycisphaera mikurensis NBRC 102666]|uniref:Uncharacterized protein n=1 Tax=Phycisphaera mikurensis (strain NBRC 102666 / KCTC 22515 / FYK2301M01) TaxID=1142394 RepID=I0IDV8_PHYMF|nr:hypothetical protein PSMK_12870 [Phycisphaera mikurensis NBRC 102666]